MIFYFEYIKNKAPFEGKNSLEECMTLQENSMRSICLEKLSDNELFKNGAGVCEIVWEWKGGGSHDMLNDCYTRAAKYFRKPEFCKNLKKYNFNTNQMYNPEGYDSECIKEFFKISTDSELENIDIKSICGNLRWRYDNEKNSCLAKYKNS